MANPSKKKGTEFEVRNLPWLRAIWPDAIRVSNTLGVNDKGDYANTGAVLVEAKKTETWLLPAWIRKVREKAEGRPWLIIMAQDQRKLPGTYVVMEADFAQMLLATWVESTP
jgi:hypothetical protein